MASALDFWEIERDERRRDSGIGQFRAHIAKIASGQPWIAGAPVFFCVAMGFAKAEAQYKLAGATQVIHDALEGFIAAADGASSWPP